MFDRNTMAQLSQLKKEIIASKEFAEGEVVGANGRFGFVKLDDGRDAFLNPDKMARVLPGDRVKVSLTQNDKGQLEADLESLLSTDLEQFVGQYKIKGKAHFVLPEDSKQSRWLFLPPQFRGKCQENDYVKAEVLRHPFRDGKAAAKILERLGRADDAYIQHNLVCARFDLFRHWGKDVQQQVQQCQTAAQSLADREDLTQLPFVTIDSAATRDMDDALWIEPLQASQPEAGWRLHVAIADPASFIAPGSPIAKSARKHAQSVYLPGRSLPMLPDNLATETFSLLPDQPRPALVCSIDLNNDGAVAGFRFHTATIKSHQKLSYQDVSDFLAGQTEAIAGCPEDLLPVLKALSALADARHQYRQTHHLVHDEQPDYDWTLNQRGHIESISKRERNPAHRLVEEAMLLTNICAGEFLASHGAGVFTAHRGFRADRLGEVKALLHEELGADYDLSKIAELDGYIALTQELRAGDKSYLLAPLKRMMNTAELSTEPAPHMSMGLPHYAPISSPIRRYADLCNQWSVHQVLQNQKVQTLPDNVLQQLRDAISAGRQANRQLEQTLTGQYLMDNPDIQGLAVIRIVTQQGFGVKMLDNGIEGFVQFPKKQEKTFDAKRMTLTVAGQVFALDNEVSVKVTGVDMQKRRVRMQLLDTPAQDSEATPAPASSESVTG